MLKRLGLSLACATVLAAGPVAVVTSQDAEARTCKKRFVTAWGNRKDTMYGARVSARLAWKRASRDINGTKYDTWWPTKRKSMKCYTNRAGKKRCRARGRPCTIL